MESDVIYRQDTIDAINTWDKFGIDERSRVVRWREGLEPYVKLRDVIWAIEKMPSAQPERKKGKWIYKKDLKQFFCDQCGEPSLTDDDRYIYSMDFSNFCPNCGADMRGDRDED